MDFCKLLAKSLGLLATNVGTRPRILAGWAEIGDVCRSNAECLRAAIFTLHGQTLFRLLVVAASYPRRSLRSRASVLSKLVDVRVNPWACRVASTAV